MNSYSVDLLTDISYEIRDILPEAENILYLFITSKSEMSYASLFETVNSSTKNGDLTYRIIDLLLWYGFLGIKTDTQEIKYIYNINYSMQLLKGMIQKKKEELVFSINPGFWPSLSIDN